MKCPGSTMVPNDTPRGVTPYGEQCCEKIRKLLGHAQGVPLLPRDPGEDDDAGDKEEGAAP